MAVRRLAPKELQPDSFAFTAENAIWAGQQIAKYPEGRQASAVIALLWKAQEQSGGWLPEPAIRAVADLLKMPYIRVLEVATFYTMFNLEPVGKHFVQLCGTTPCMLRGAEKLKEVLKRKIGEEKHVTADGKFSWMEVECLGACCNAPMAQINNDYYEDLTPETLEKLLDDLAAGRPVKPGPQNGRRASEPEGAITTLSDPSLYDGSQLGAWRKRFEAEAAEKARAEAEAAAAAPSAAQTPEPAKSKETRPEEKASDRPEVRVAEGKAPIAQAAKDDAAPVVSDEHKPALLSKPRDEGPDDLKLIYGVGPKLAAMLNELGIYHFDQIASWNEMNLAWVDQHLGAFRGRAVRDKWIEQAKKLATGWRPASDVGEKPEE